MRLGFDCDDVLADFEPALVRWYNENFQPNLAPGDLTPNHLIWENIVGLEKSKKIWELFANPDFALSLLPVEGAQEGVQTLYQKGAELYVITSRSVTPDERTTEWLKRYFPGMIKEVLYGSSYGALGRKTKGELCLDKKLNLFVDDLPRHLRDVNVVGIPGLLYTRKWNEEFQETELIKRVND